MSEYQETCEVFGAERQERHAKWYAENMAIIKASDIKFTDKGNAILIRGYVNADFYPHTGRWRFAGKTYNGGAKKFLSFIIVETAKKVEANHGKKI